MGHYAQDADNYYENKKTRTIAMLECQCGSFDFKYVPDNKRDGKFVCKKCGYFYHTEEAGRNLVLTTED